MTRTATLLAVLTATLLLAPSGPAAAADSGGKPVSPPPAEETTTFVWAFHEVEGRAFLAYGEPETDNIAISFFCWPGEGAVHASLALEEPAPAAARWTATFSLRSGHHSGRYSGRALVSEEVGPMIEDARIPIGDPVLAAFQSTGALTVQDHPLGAATPQDRGRIAAFFARCRRP